MKHKPITNWLKKIEKRKKGFFKICYAGLSAFVLFGWFFAKVQYTPGVIACFIVAFIFIMLLLLRATNKKHPSPHETNLLTKIKKQIDQIYQNVIEDDKTDKKSDKRPKLEYEYLHFTIIDKGSKHNLDAIEFMPASNQILHKMRNHFITDQTVYCGKANFTIAQTNTKDVNNHLDISVGNNRNNLVHHFSAN